MLVATNGYSFGPGSRRAKPFKRISCKQTAALSKLSRHPLFPMCPSKNPIDLLQDLTRGTSAAHLSIPDVAEARLLPKLVASVESQCLLHTSIDSGVRCTHLQHARTCSVDLNHGPSRQALEWSPCGESIAVLSARELMAVQAATAKRS